MSSIDNRPKGGPSFDPTGAAGAGQSNALDGDTLAQAAIHGADLQAVNQAGTAQPVTAPSAKQQVKMAGSATLLATPPPLPPTRGTIQADTAANYASLTQDIAAAQAKGMPAKSFNVQSLIDLASDPKLQTPAGRQAAVKQVDLAVNSGIKQLNAMSSASMMAAFLELNVKNQASGKEMQANMLDLATQSRNNQIQAQIVEREAQAAAVKKAEQKKKALGPLMIIVQVALAIATVMTAGATAPLIAACMTVGAVVGGAVQGQKDGTGFSLKGALEGATMGAGVAGLKGIVMSLIKMAMSLLMKVGAKASTKIVSTTGAKAAQQAASASTKGGTGIASTVAQNTGKRFANLRAGLAEKKAEQLAEAAAQQAAQQGQGIASKASGGAIFAAGKGTGHNVGRGLQAFRTAGADMDLVRGQLAITLVTAVQTVVQAGIDYKHKTLLLKAKEHEANAKGMNVQVDMAQSRWEDIQASLQGITDAHNKASDQALEMINRQHRVAMKAAGNITG